MKCPRIGWLTELLFLAEVEFFFFVMYRLALGPAQLFCEIINRGSLHGAMKPEHEADLLPLVLRLRMHGSVILPPPNVLFILG